MTKVALNLAKIYERQSSYLTYENVVLIRILVTSDFTFTMGRTRFHSLTSIVQPLSQGSVGTGRLLGPHFNISLISSAIAGILSTLLQLD